MKRLFFLFLAITSSLTTIAQDYYVNVENDYVKRFLDNTYYTDVSSTSTVVRYYIEPNNLCSLPNPAVLTVPEHAAADQLTVTYSQDEDFENATTEDIVKDAQEALIYNLIPCTVYYYKMMADDEVIAQGKIITDGRLRMIRVPVGGFNIRDLGGWPTEDGLMVKYGKLFRGSELNGKYVADELSISILKQLGIGAELDFRYKSENEGAGISAFGFVGSAESDDYDYLFTNNMCSTLSQLKSTYYRPRIRSSFEFVVRQLKKGNAVYMHCIWGIDRTGIFAMILEGLLGLNYDSLMKEYEMSYFIGSNKFKSKLDDVYKYFESLEGNTLQEKFIYYMSEIVGVNTDDIDYFISEMLMESSNTTVSVESVKEESKSFTGDVFNLQGQRVGNDAKGMLIKNGKLIIKK